MTLSIWRFSHLFLALISAFFIMGAAVSGTILSLSSIQQKNLQNQYGDLNEISLSQFCDSLDVKFKEIYSIHMIKGVAEVTALTNSGRAETLFVNPMNANMVIEPNKESRVFAIARMFHRSLMLKKTGRILVGISSLLLLFISVTGLILLCRRQGSFINIFRKISKENFYTYWHTQLSRFFLIPTILISLTGVYLSLERFEIIPTIEDTVHQLPEIDLDAVNSVKASEVEVFKEINLFELKSLTFPFSPFPEDGDHYQVQTAERDILVDQFTGRIISNYDFEFQHKLAVWSYAIHTGEGSVSWSVILCMTCCSLLFFIFSGVKITLNRRKHKRGNSFKVTKSEYIILVGSENGNTMRYARSLYDLLIINRKTVFLDYLNNYKVQKHKHHLIIMTSTYGLGEPPANANRFLKKLKSSNDNHEFDFSVLGFGSRNYPDFCQFAIDVDEALSARNNARRQTEIGFVDRQSQADFDDWKDLWCSHNKILKTQSIIKEVNGYEDFRVVQISNPEQHPKLTFRLKLKSKESISFVSGDLLAIKIETEGQERLYSVGRGSNNEIILYIKVHPFGVYSHYLSNLELNDRVNARIISNEKFHAPSKFRSLIMIANGTGIAPFIGMAMENDLKGKIHLFWGGNSEDDYGLYKKDLLELKNESKINSIRTIFSENKNRYVQELISDHDTFIGKELKNGSTIMICGSLAMGRAVLDQLNTICKTQNLEELAYYQNKAQIKMDCY